MNQKRFPEEFKIEAVRQIVEGGRPVAESFFQLLKRKRIRRQIYPTRQDARADVINYVEMF
jgi:hypothetical protein